MPDEPGVGDEVQEVVFAGVDEEAGAVGGGGCVCHQRVPRGGGNGEMTERWAARYAHSMIGDYTCILL